MTRTDNTRAKALLDKAAERASHGDAREATALRHEARRMQRQAQPSPHTKLVPLGSPCRRRVVYE